VRSVLGKGKKNPLPQRVPGPRLPLGVIIAAMTLGLIALAALFPWLLTGENPLETDSSATLQPPSADHFFLGPTSPVGMFFARVVYGARYSLAVGLGATACALLVGILLGVGAARGPRILDTALSRFIDVVMAFPEFLLALIVIAVIGWGVPVFLSRSRSQQSPPMPEWLGQKLSLFPRPGTLLLPARWGFLRELPFFATSSRTSLAPYS